MKNNLHATSHTHTKERLKIVFLPATSITENRVSLFVSPLTDFIQDWFLHFGNWNMLYLCHAAAVDFIS